jgi:hypothetical protein
VPWKRGTIRWSQPGRHFHVGSVRARKRTCWRWVGFGNALEPEKTGLVWAVSWGCRDRPHRHDARRCHIEIGRRPADRLGDVARGEVGEVLLDHPRA